MKAVISDSVYAEVMQLKGTLPSSEVGKKFHVAARTVRYWWSGATQRSSTPTPQPIVTTALQSLSLKDVRISDHKPADSVKRLIYLLKKGMGFPVDRLSETWGISSERIKKEARRFECLKYVETDPGNWVLCVMHPDTASEYRKELT